MPRARHGLKRIMEPTLVVSQRYKDFPPGWGHIKVPLSSRRAALAALGLYAPCRLGSLLAQRAARAYVAILGPRALPGPSLPWAPMDEAEWLELSKAWRRAVGPFDGMAGYLRLQVTRRGLALLLLREGSPIAFVKVREGDGDALMNEGRAVAAVWSYRPRAFQVPEPLQYGSSGGWHYLLSAPLPAGLGPPPRNPPLRAILDEVAASLAVLPRPAACPDHWRPMHGDLAPWNLRRLHEHAFVLIDWENAGWGPPGADEIYYRATRAALRNQRAGHSDAHEAVQFWRKRVSAATDTARDRRLAQALDKVLAGMGRS